MNTWRTPIVILTSGILVFQTWAQAPSSDPKPEDVVEHPNCSFFGPDLSKSAQTAISATAVKNPLGPSATTQQVASQLASLPFGTRSDTSQKLNQQGMIDQYLFAAMRDGGVVPANDSTDYEFIRRITLDLTGRIPTPDRVLSFVNDKTVDKRARLVDELLAKPEWVDKWTMFYGDLFQNNRSNSQINRYQDGVKAFYAYTKASLQANKPYDQMARELITAQGTNSYDAQQGAINWITGFVVGGGPIQDIFDSQTVGVSQTFLGISHLNCLLCHNGRGHLDALSLWGKSTTRQQAWGMASFLSHTYTFPTRVDPAKPTPQYWGVQDDGPKVNKDYQLNTTTGNRPTRAPINGTQKSVPPVYLFSGRGPKSGEDYRVAFAREVTGDFQFSRAAVNYLWAYFFGVGLVDPPDQFDPARLDPDNPPPDPWTLQASNPRLLNALAQAFVDNKYDVKWLMREIVNSRAYQLSARYDGDWNPAWQNLYARKLVRRLWAEEVHDAVAQSSNVIPSYNLGAVYGTTSYAMQFPETLTLPGGSVGQFLDSFLRGNRDDQPRSGEGSILQALSLMNDNFVMTRTKSTGVSTSLLVKNLSLPDDQLVNTLFLNVLSRYPNNTEMTLALANLKSGNRNQEAENLLWSLYNKVDFIYNY